MLRFLMKICYYPIPNLHTGARQIYCFLMCQQIEKDSCQDIAIFLPLTFHWTHTL